YNPFSVLKALSNREIAPYWFATGTPTFLVNRIKARGTYPPDINGQKCTKNELLSVGITDSNPLPIMFQTGYLTIDSYNDEMEMYALRFPNREVEIGFYQDLLPVYAPPTADPDSPFSLTKFKEDLYEGRPDDFMNRIETLLKNLPGEDQSESVYRAVTFLLATLSSTRSIAEHHGYKGRSDLEIITGDNIYLMEFKYNKSVEKAMEQIHARDYAGRYSLDSRTVYIIGVNFENNKGKRIMTYQIEKL
ncbi:MAG: PD-(D/E)XK nuclease domain-containing protein, partial [Muribaculaceae bacterium]|nr:PD-(D/E)XK nuclease domain-containing protein [Muribaculaceae bacterium]